MFRPGRTFQIGCMALVVLFAPCQGIIHHWMFHSKTLETAVASKSSDPSGCNCKFHQRQMASRQVANDEERSDGPCGSVPAEGVPSDRSDLPSDDDSCQLCHELSQPQVASPFWIEVLSSPDVSPILVMLERQFSESHRIESGGARAPPGC